jgi:hypothetical protein
MRKWARQSFAAQKKETKQNKKPISPRQRQGGVKRTSRAL